MDLCKKTVHLNGRLIFPLVVGKQAVFVSGGRVIRTSRVTVIRKESPILLCFETMNTRYHVSLSPFPLEAARAVPLEALAA